MDNKLLFLNNVKKVKGKRIHTVTKSLGVYSAYKWIRKNKWLDINRNLSEHEFYSIIRKINNFLAEELSNGNNVSFPNRMGMLELRKYNPPIKLVNNKVITNLPIDWNRTLKLWYEDKESYKNKTLVKVEEKEIYKIYYNKSKANYNNKLFYQFKVNREIKQNLKYNIRKGYIDAFKF